MGLSRPISVRIASALCVAAIPGRASAQDADRFAMTGSGPDGWGTVERVHPDVGPAGSAYAGIGVGYARNPLTVRKLDGTPVDIVSDQFGTTAMVGWTLTRDLRFDLAAPVYPWMVVEGEPQVARGDLTLGALWSLTDHTAGNTAADVDIGVYPHISFPTASAGAMLSNGGPSGGLLLSAGDHRRYSS